MAAGSHGCNPNWADFPIAANRHPHRRGFIRRSAGWGWLNSASIVQVECVIIIYPAARSIPMSPARL